jgi:RNA polymerase sigma factor (sigma-70 family)
MLDENELYEKWLGTGEADRNEVEGQLSTSVQRHAQAVVWENLQETHPDSVQKIVMAVMTQLGAFRGKSKFSTWVHAIAQHIVDEELRRRTRYRQVFDETKSVATDPHEEIENRARSVVPTILPDFEGPIAFAEFSEGLSDEDAALLRYKRDGLSSKEAAERMGTTVEAVDSRWARLKPKVEKEFRTERRK